MEQYDASVNGKFYNVKKYNAKYPTDKVHCDSCSKLATFGFGIHGRIECYCDAHSLVHVFGAAARELKRQSESQNRPTEEIFAELCNKCKSNVNNEMGVTVPQ